MRSRISVIWRLRPSVTRVGFLRNFLKLKKITPGACNYVRKKTIHTVCEQVAGRQNASDVSFLFFRIFRGTWWFSLFSDWGWAKEPRSKRGCVFLEMLIKLFRDQRMEWNCERAVKVQFFSVPFDDLISKDTPWSRYEGIKVYGLPGKEGCMMAFILMC